MGRINETAMKQIVQRLYPKGKIWDATLNDDVSVDVRATMFAETYDYLEKLLEETDVRTALLKLNDYATEYGISVSGLPLSTARKLLFLKKNARGGQSVSYFEKLLKNYGANGNVEECAPLVCGLSESGGDDQCGNEDTAYMWFVNITGGGYVEFRCGESECGDSLGEYDAGLSALVALLEKNAPAHTNLTVTLK